MAEYLAKYGPHAALSRTLVRWSQTSQLPLVLLIDEIDTLVGDTLISVLRQLRANYDRRPHQFPQSVILCGVRDVRGYRIYSSRDGCSLSLGICTLGQVPAENDNMYTISISEDGMFSAEYVVPPALSVPLGISGSAVDVIKNEDGTFSALINGEYEVVTADTMVTAENGNVYRALLSPEGIVIGVDHVPAMQDVMLGALGGTITLTQAEDKSWWYGTEAVATGYVHTADNGNMYALTLDSEGMWSAMYQKVEVMVTLGTQGSITLVRAEDMSWWLGSEAVDVASEVMSDNGNTYTLWYTDGVWSARFEPESMMIEGTGLVAMTREADDMYDVDGDTLPASGAGEITTSAGAMYRVSMMNGMLSGVRFDGAPKGDTVFITVGLDSDLAPDAEVSYIADDRDTAFNEANTKVTVAGESISLGDLLGDGMASKAKAASDGLSGEFVNSAKDVLMDLLTEAELYAKYQAVAEDDEGAECVRRAPQQHRGTGAGRGRHDLRHQRYGRRRREEGRHHRRWRSSDRRHGRRYRSHRLYPGHPDGAGA